MNQLNTQSFSHSTDSSLPPKRKRWRAVLLGLIILICGFAMGSGVTVIVVRKMAHIIHTPGEAPKRITERMRRKLDLTDAQAAKVQAILTEREKALLGIFREIQPRLRKELERTREDVAAVLDSEQAKKWRERFDYLQNKWVPPHVTNEQP